MVPEAPDPVKDKGAMDGMEALTTIATDIEKKLDGIQKSGKLKSIGLSLMGFFLLVNLCWYTLKAMATGTGLNGFIADFIGLAVVTAVVAAFLSKDVGSTIIGTIDSISSAVLGGDPTRRMGDAIAHVAKQAFQTLAHVGAIKPAGDQLKGTEWLIGLLPTALTVVSMKMLTMFFVVTSVCIYIAMLVYSQVMITIALVLAPFMVPFLMFQPGSFLFDSWLRFLLGSAMIKFVGMLMAMITGGMMESMGKISVSTDMSSASWVEAMNFDIVLFGSIMLLAGLSAMMMMQIPSIANALVGGSSVGFSGWGALARSPSSQAMGRAGGSGGRAGGESGSKGTSKNVNDGNVSKAYAGGRILGSAIRGR